MSRSQVINETLKAVNQLPDERVNEVTDFASFLLKRQEETTLQKGIEHLVNTSGTFAFLHDEDDLYTLNDLKETYK